MSTAKLYTISVYSDNSPGVLQRVSTSFTKRKINIESLTVSETSEDGLSLFTIMAYVPSDHINTVVRQIERVIEVRKVYASLDDDLVFREAALVRVALKKESSLQEIEEIIERHSAGVIYVDEESAVIQTYGTEEDTQVVYKLLIPFGVLQFVRTGRIALRKSFISVHDQ